jgi:vacuolar-type H+-ATPase subunit B/Vma2
MRTKEDHDMATRAPASTKHQVLAAYQSSRQAGDDEWTACEKALLAFARQHPEASSEFANTFISTALRERYVSSRLDAEWESIPASRPASPANHAAG